MATPSTPPAPAARPRVLALDLEGTLISNAVSQLPRPGLYAFLEWALATFERVVVFTSVGCRRGTAAPAT